MTKSKKFSIITAWLLVFLFMCAIFSLSAQNADESSSLSNGLLQKVMDFTHISLSSFAIRKLAHATEYALLALLFSNAFYRLCGNPLSSAAFSLTSIYACTDEFHQLFVSGRGCSLFDVGIDSLGALTGTLICFLIFNLYIHNKNREAK